MPPHFPFVKIRSKHVANDDDRKPSMVFTRRGKTYNLYRLSADLMRIGGEARGVDPDLSPIDLNQVGNPNFKGSLRWMFDMEELLAGAGRVNSRRILASGFPRQGRLACWLILDQGSLFTHSLGNSYQAISQWDIRRKSHPNEAIPIEGFERPVAYSIGLDVPIRESVELLFLRGKQHAPQKICLDPCGEEVLEISILNEEMEEIVDFSERRSKEGEFDDDVGAVYQLSDIGRATRDRPLPHKVEDFPLRNGGLGSDTVACGTSEGKGFQRFDTEWPAFRDSLQILYEARP